MTALKFSLTPSTLAGLASVPMLQAPTGIFIESGSAHAPGLVPDPGATAGVTRFLREDASFDVPPTFIASGSGHAPGYVPDPGASAGILRYLREDSSFNPIPLMNPSGAFASNGLAPAPPVTAGTTHFLREDATWQVPSTGLIFASYGSATTAGATGSLHNVVSGSLIGGTLTGWAGGVFTAPVSGLYSFSTSVELTSAGFTTSPGNLEWGLYFLGPTLTFGASDTLVNLTPPTLCVTRLSVKCEMYLTSGQTCTLQGGASLTGGTAGTADFNLDGITIVKLV
jgi:hypothetical protein